MERLRRALGCLLLTLVATPLSPNAAVITDEVTFSLDDLRLTHAGDYDWVTVVDAEHHQPSDSLLGAPDLPLVRLRYILPPDHRVASVEVESRGTQSIAGDVVPYPIQPQGPLGDELPFEPPDATIYDSPVAFPRSLGFVRTDGSMRGFMLADVLV